MPPITLPSRLLALPAALRSLAFKSSIQPVQSISRSYATYNTNASGTPQPQSSVNDTEVTHFNALASTWWDPHGSSRLLHLMNPLRHDFIGKCLGPNASIHKSGKGLRVLDIGCGGGIFAESAARRQDVESVTAIDPSPEVIAIAKQHRRHDPHLMQPGKLNYRNVAIEGLKSSDHEGFDIISVFEVIEHIQSPSAFLEQVLPHLKPGGWLVGSTIARTGTSWFTTKFMAEDVLRIVPRGTHEWSQYINPGEMREWARSRKELDVDVGGDGWRQMGVVYVPGLGWREVNSSESWGNYFFGARKRIVAESGKE
ncbi:unnamed protein product [Zymoseptoria tritici ST99CH_1A5]|uniref:Ubiquinone biosynthesis O-methyltransferase, mitochondrial n=2 Tax=Zymoseptoria tritici TaxID=1047171 RepID=A0A2H1G3V5_ZYMTR|nr:unnamed protein product [Zymoseptoria tritici ST99CH_1E4]SMR49525.1 unnamed protein product [Zymoseptoria tritici ST99CH_3D1]SMY22223.1 unnamed protein product [Zymoseptoria tritici ST99CH_1A5]